MTSAFTVDIHHFSLLYEISRGHTPVNCLLPAHFTPAPLQSSSVSTEELNDAGGSLLWDKRRRKWRVTEVINGHSVVLVTILNNWIKRIWQRPKRSLCIKKKNRHTFAIGFLWHHFWSDGSAIQKESLEVDIGREPRRFRNKKRNRLENSCCSERTLAMALRHGGFISRLFSDVFTSYFSKKLSPHHKVIFLICSSFCYASRSIDRYWLTAWNTCWVLSR